MIRAFVLFTLSSILVSSCVISKRSNMSFVRNSQIDSDAEVMSVSVSTFLAKPIVKKALQDDDDEESEAITKLVSSLRGVRVLVIENQSDFTKINKRLDNYLNRKHYEEWVSVVSDGDRVKLNAKVKSNKIKRLMVSVNSTDGESVFVRLKGKFSLDDISESIGTLTDSNLRKKVKKEEEKETAEQR